MKIRLNKIMMASVLFLLIAGMVTDDPKPKPTIVEISTRFGVMRVLLYDETPLHRDNFLKLVRQKFYDSLTFHQVIRDYTIQGGSAQSRFATDDSVIGDEIPAYRIPAEFRPNLIHKFGALAAARDINPEMASHPTQFFIVKGRHYSVAELKKIETLRNQVLKSNILHTLSEADTTKARMADFSLRGDKEGMKEYLQSFQSVADTIFKRRGEFRFTLDQISTYTSIGGAPHLDSGYTVFGEVISGLHIIDSINMVQCATNNRPVKDIRMKIRVVRK